MSEQQTADQRLDPKRRGLKCREFVATDWCDAVTYVNEQTDINPLTVLQICPPLPGSKIWAVIYE